jgi:ABC-type multidrug transport system ATPase subunit
MTIELSNAGKRFNRDWIFRGVTYHFQAGKSYAITGANGSGKSTLLQSISGSITLSEGDCSYTGNMPVNNETVYRQLAMAAPYLELIEEMTADEFLRFHASFKPMIFSADEILSMLGLKNASHKQIRYFSSGMKQRIKLAQAIFSDVPLLLLDEPCTNLDKAGYELYHRLIAGYTQKKLVIVSSNDPLEYDFCDERLQMSDYK